MRSVTVLEVANNARRAMNLNTWSSIPASTTDLEQAQMLAAINWANGIIFCNDSAYWSEYFGTLITIGNKKSYELTPETYNYIPLSRSFAASTTLTNCTATPMNAVSYDDTVKATKITGIGSNPSVSKTTVGTCNNGFISASLWLQADGTNTPNTSTTTPYDVTISLTDTVGGQSQSATYTLSTQLDRYVIQGYFTSAQTSVILKVTWNNPTGVVYMDQWQVEINDYASENIENATTSPILRTVFTDPSRLFGVARYRPGTMRTFQDVYYVDPSLYPSEKSQRYFSAALGFWSTTGGILNLDQVASGTHIIYRGKRTPPVFTSGADIINIPDPWHWVLVMGARAFVMAAGYDMGANQDVTSAMNGFVNYVDKLFDNTINYPAFTFVYNPYPRMK